MCVVKTPPVYGESLVVPVTDVEGSEFEFDIGLVNRASYLSRNHMFSIKVYEDQYLHVHQGCVTGDCTCLYYLDGVLSKMRPCRVAATMYVENCWSNEDIFVLTGMCRGFRIMDGFPDLSYNIPNYRSILHSDMARKMNDNITKELIEGTISPVTHPPRCVHALGAILRPDGRIRPITDCSEPAVSINDFMWETAPRFKFSNVHDTRVLVEEGGYGAVVDISNAYRNILIFPPHREYVGLNWNPLGRDQYYVDNALCFGLKSAPSIFNAVSNFVTRVMGHRGSHIVGYLDDYFLASNTKEGCHTRQKELIEFLEFIGFKVNYNKVIPPSQQPRFLGVEIDLVNMVFRLPEDKLLKARGAVEELLSKTFTSHKKLERLTGYLAHCAVLVKGGRTFCRRLYSLLKATKGVKKIKVSDVVKRDLSWWKAFLEIFNGTCKIIPNTIPLHEFYTDASGTGFGGWWGKEFFFGYWDSSETICSHQSTPPVVTELSHSSINVKELWPVVEALSRWGPYWKDSEVLLHSDNTQVLSMICTGRSSNHQSMSLLREIFWQCAIFNIYKLSV